MQPSHFSSTELGEAQSFIERGPNAALSTRKILLGEELPIFCEKCGYALHGLAQEVCAHCSIRQFHCPECGHHQPINTLRPAAMKMLGRLRAFVLAIWVILKILFFGGFLIGWVSVGYHEPYQYDFQAYSSYRQTGSSRIYYDPPVRVRELDVGSVAAFSICGFFYGAIGRMLLLRWRRGFWVGLSLGILVCLALVLGAVWRYADSRITAAPLPNPLGGDFTVCILIAFAGLMLGASVVWAVWSALAFVFLPKRTSQALLDWQRSQSNGAVVELVK